MQSCGVVVSNTAGGTFLCFRSYAEGGGVVCGGRDRANIDRAAVRCQEVRTAEDDYVLDAVTVLVLHMVCVYPIPGHCTAVVRLACLFHHLLSPNNKAAAGDVFLHRCRLRLAIRTSGNKP